MLLLDTSASMQDAVNGAAGVQPTCHDTRQSGFDYARSRWAVTVEVLTGTFNDYWCSYDHRNAPSDSSKEDFNALPPHVMPRGVDVSGDEQQGNGLLDLYEDSIKFGLMTSDPNPSTGTNANGGYSFGPNKSSSSGIFNLGAHNGHADWGRLTAPSANDNPNNVRNTNRAIQEQILAARPYAGTPVSPLLQDALHFFQTDNSVKPQEGDSGPGDPYYDCRSKSIILVTDGQNPLAEGTLGYPFSSAVAAELLANGITVYVVGFNLAPEANTALLNNVAEAGGSDSAFIAQSPAQLVTALGAILTRVQSNQPAQARTVITNRTLNVDDRQYQFNASFSGTAASPLDLEGHLDQFIYRCEQACEPPDWDGGAALCEVFDIGQSLDNRLEPRNILTQLEGTLVPFTIENGDITADHLGVPTDGELPRLDPLTLESGLTILTGIVLGDAGDATVRQQYRDQLIRLVRADADSRRATIRLGAIVHSQPAVQTNLFNVRSPIPSFRVYRNQEEIRMRPTALFVGTHDGQMHAFRVDRLADLDDADFGTELWSFVPKHLLGQLNRLANGSPYLMDGRPTVAEVRMLKESASLDIEEEVERWKSVLVSGYREGGRGYFALDVTNPAEPAFMWEISNTERCFNVPDASAQCIASTAFARLGKSFSQAAIGTVFYSDAGESAERAVAIFGGGEEIEGEDESGRSLFVVNLEDGSVIREFCNSCGNVYDTNQASQNNTFLDCPLIGPVAAHDTYPGAQISRAFIGDACGQLWRLDVSSVDPEEWRLEFFHDAFASDGLPIGHAHRRRLALAPALATGYSPGRLVVIYGTGDPEVSLDPGDRDRVYSLSEFWTGDGFEAQVNWELILENRERFGSDPLVFDSIAFFTTQTRPEGACNVGNGRLWGLDFNGDTQDVTTDLVAMLDADGDPATSDAVQFNEYPNAELVGLQVAQRMPCFASPLDFQPWLGGEAEFQAQPPSFGSLFPQGGSSGAQFGGSSGGNLELVVQTGTTGTSSPEMQPPEGGGTPTTGNKTVQSLVAPSQTVFSTSWGLVFD